MFDSRRGGSHLDGGMHKWYSAECEVCGETYSFTPEHVYKGCCSWTCYNKKMARDGRNQKEEARKKKEMETAEMRVKKCEAKVRYYEAIRDSVKGKEAIKSAKASLLTWQQHLSRARIHLKNLMEEREDD